MFIFLCNRVWKCKQCGQLQCFQKALGELAALGGLPPAAPAPPAFRTLTNTLGTIRAGLAAGDGRGHTVSWDVCHVTLAAGNVELGK